ncbi:hypothetical protein BaRGS_00010085 [Batillaria attramentaria]|uniref:Uncharacterized protein n=1 Tax=Batillaria attramentaria TaxID=370345 RepID=A0ABD0LHX9_9CAEN
MANTDVEISHTTMYMYGRENECSQSGKSVGWLYSTAAETHTEHSISTATTAHFGKLRMTRMCKVCSYARIPGKSSYRTENKTLFDSHTLNWRLVITDARQKSVGVRLQALCLSTFWIEMVPLWR